MADLQKKISKQFSKSDVNNAAQTNKFEYMTFLSNVREEITREKADDLAAIILDPKAKKQLRIHIVDYIKRHGAVLQGFNTEELADQAFSSMAGFDFLDELIYDPTVEEINGSWEFTRVTYAGVGKVIYPRHFESPKHARNILTKMCKLGGKVLDRSHPDIDSYIAEGARVSALIPPIVPESDGVSYSIRLQRKNVISKEEMVANKTVTQDEIDFILDITKYGIPIIIAGMVDTGKTNDANVIANEIPVDKDIFTIEEDREFKNMTKRDEQGNIQNFVIMTATRESDNENLDRRQKHLFKRSLRHHAEYTFAAEIRGEEAYTAVQSALAGSCTITTLHSDTARDAYHRVRSMCRADSNAARLDDLTLSKDIVKAFPIVVYKHKLKDLTRRVVEIVEAVDYVDGEFVCNTLFAFDIKRNIYNKNDGCVKIDGEHKKGAALSERLIQRMLRNGAPDEILNKYRKGGKK